MKADDRHYRNMKLQPKDLYEQVPAFKAYPMIAAIKYVSRAKHKGQERRDLEQARNCLDWMRDWHHKSGAMPLLAEFPAWQEYLDQFDDDPWIKEILSLIGSHSISLAVWHIDILLKTMPKRWWELLIFWR